MRRLSLLVAWFCLVSMPVWADYGLSNVVEEQIDRSQLPGESLPVPPDEMTPVAPVHDQAQPVKKPEESAPQYKKTEFYPYTIHISSWQSKKDALNHQKRQSRDLKPVFITKIDLGATGIWYRVDYGNFTSKGAATARMNDLMARGVIDAESFIGSAVPYTIELGVFRDEQGAAGEAGRLREKGVVTYIMREADSVFRLLSGAYPGQKSAGPALEDFVALGLQPKIAKR
ncbi:MAG TPA: SPOR domain-containing protein [Deltaproteobacteria bacterium]|nr:MAG: Sporulation related domain protein [Deltaproteobacteria bacterium ADurb.Bin072]HNQ85845.1 SPOR domain-containing protein [Deltaproteobacteria bacterium]HNS90115.1 SPOR domain-containing protein [Deltaproteobacteria bacterium]HOA43507.1 SPOR domain-containing protein [Deltaproteobacteria bacterium]HOC74589.1 SPOR domain-containing protein [Deltaproteobacteria bacterium]